MELTSIGEFARRSRLSPKALRLYDRLGLLSPAWIDPDSGYRWYAPGQLERAHLIASLRELALHLLDRLHGKEPAMYDVGTRDLPARQLLCLQRHLHATAMVTVGKEFVGKFRNGAAPKLEGVAGAPFVIFYGHVSEDSDGPVEWCWPVPGEQAAEQARRFPELTLRTDPAHQEAFVHLPGPEEAGGQWLPVTQAMETWAEAHHRQPAGWIRQLLIWPRTSPGYGPECDFAIPLVPGEFR